MNMPKFEGQQKHLYEYSRDGRCKGWTWDMGHPKWNERRKDRGTTLHVGAGWWRSRCRVDDDSRPMVELHAYEQNDTGHIPRIGSIIGHAMRCRWIQWYWRKAQHAASKDTRGRRHPQNRSTMMRRTIFWSRLEKAAAMKCDTNTHRLARRRTREDGLATQSLSQVGAPFAVSFRSLPDFFGSVQFVVCPLSRVSVGQTDCFFELAPHWAFSFLIQTKKVRERNRKFKHEMVPEWKKKRMQVWKN